MGHWYSWPSKSRIMKCKTWGINPWWSWAIINLSVAKTNSTHKKGKFSAKLAFWASWLCDYTTASSSKAGGKREMIMGGWDFCFGQQLVMKWEPYSSLATKSIFHTFSVQPCGLPLPFNPAYQSYLVGLACDLLRGISGKRGQRAEEGS